MGTKKVKLEHSRKKVGRAGEVLQNMKSELAENTDDAYEVLSNWRASHVYPMQKIQKILSKQAPKIDRNAIVAQRLKRTPSIINKLDRFPSMKLHRMQDIGGCRVILNKFEDVNKLKIALIRNKSKHILVKEHNYMDTAKESGYRGIHLIFKYQGTSIFDYDNHLVEVQLRSKIQHAWATAVEIFGTFVNESLKTSQGSDKYLNAFAEISEIFAYYESKPDINEDEKKYLTSLVGSTIILDIAEKLASFTMGTNSFDKTKQLGYYTIEMTTNDYNVEVKHYRNNELDVATSYYLEKEKESNSNIVLVTVESFNKLKKAYPNYFADSSFFVKTLNNAMTMIVKKSVE